MRGVRTSVVQGDQEASVRDLISLVINAESLIPSLSSLRQEDRCSVVIALVPVGRRNNETEPEFPQKRLRI